MLCRKQQSKRGFGLAGDASRERFACAIHALRQWHRYAGRSKRGLTRTARSAAESENEARLTLNALSSSVGMSPHQLERAFRSVMGISPRQYADAQRMQRLKSKLKKGDDVTTALYDAGFGSSSRLYERAPSQLGMTPATYRQGGTGMQINYTIVGSPLGRLLVGATHRGISALYLGKTMLLCRRLCEKNTRGRKLAAIAMAGGLGGQNTRPSSRARAESGFTHRCASNRVSTPGVGRIAQDPVRRDAHVQPSGTSDWEAEGRSSGCASVRHESCFSCSSLPPRGAARRQLGRVSLGTRPKTKAAGARIRAARRGNGSGRQELTNQPQRWPRIALALRLDLFSALGPVGFEIRVAEVRVAHDLRIANNEIISRSGFVKLLLHSGAKWIRRARFGSWKSGCGLPVI